MRLSQLRYFIEVCRYENITKAAQYLCVSQPALTIAIKNLEDELGINLFHRIKQRIFLTEEGNYFYNKIKEIIESIDTLADSIGAIKSDHKSVKIGLPPMVSSYVLPKVLRSFQSDYPNISLELCEYGTLELQNMLIDECLDLAILVDEKTSKHELTTKPILETKNHLYVSPNNPLSGKELVKISDLQDIPLIMFNKGFQINQIVSETFEKQGITPKIILYTGQVHTVKRFVSEGIAAGFLTQDCICPEDNIVKVPLDVEFIIKISLAWKTGRYLYSDAAAFIRYIDEFYKNFQECI